jgi:hypothetical protein
LNVKIESDKLFSTQLTEKVMAKYDQQLKKKADEDKP